MRKCTSAQLQLGRGHYSNDDNSAHTCPASIPRYRRGFVAVGQSPPCLHVGPKSRRNRTRLGRCTPHKTHYRISMPSGRYIYPCSYVDQVTYHMSYLPTAATGRLPTTTCRPAIVLQVTAHERRNRRVIVEVCSPSARRAAN